MKKNMCFFILAIGVMFIFPNSVPAHNFWININESNTPPAHVMMSIGYGHKMPMDEYLSSPQGVIKLKEYNLYDPDHNVLHIEYENPDAIDVKKLPVLSGAMVRTGDMFDRGIAFSPDMKPGTWQVTADQDWMFATLYKNKDGKRIYERKELNKIKEVQSILFSMAAKMSAKSFFTVGGKWTEPKPVGHLIEIIPTSDLSNLKVGDSISFKVLHNGKALDKFNRGEIPFWPYFCAFGTNFGGEEEGFHLAGYLNNGEGRLKIPASGQWVVYSYLYLPIDKDLNPELYGKAKYQYISASISFNVK